VDTYPICEYQLGGKDNYAADRAAVDAVFKVAPEMGFAARANRWRSRGTRPAIFYPFGDCPLSDGLPGPDSSCQMSSSARTGAGSVSAARQMRLLS